MNELYSKQLQCMEDLHGVVLTRCTASPPQDWSSTKDATVAFPCDNVVYSEYVCGSFHFCVWVLAFDHAHSLKNLNRLVERRAGKLYVHPLSIFDPQSKVKLTSWQQLEENHMEITTSAMTTFQTIFDMFSLDVITPRLTDYDEFVSMQMLYAISLLFGRSYCKSSALPELTVFQEVFEAFDTDILPSAFVAVMPLLEVLTNHLLSKFDILRTQDVMRFISLSGINSICCVMRQDEFDRVGYAATGICNTRVQKRNMKKALDLLCLRYIMEPSALTDEMERIFDHAEDMFRHVCNMHRIEKSSDRQVQCVICNSKFSCLKLAAGIVCNQNGAPICRECLAQAPTTTTPTPTTAQTTAQTTACPLSTTSSETATLETNKSLCHARRQSDIFKEKALALEKKLASVEATLQKQETRSNKEKKEMARSLKQQHQASISKLLTDHRDEISALNDKLLAAETTLQDVTSRNEQAHKVDAANQTLLAKNQELQQSMDKLCDEKLKLETLVAQLRQTNQEEVEAATTLRARVQECEEAADRAKRELAQHKKDTEDRMIGWCGQLDNMVAVLSPNRDGAATCSKRSKRSKFIVDLSVDAKLEASARAAHVVRQTIDNLQTRFDGVESELSARKLAQKVASSESRQSLVVLQCELAACDSEIAKHESGRRESEAQRASATSGEASKMNEANDKNQVKEMENWKRCAEAWKERNAILTGECKAAWMAHEALCRIVDKRLAGLFMR